MDYETQAALVNRVLDHLDKGSTDSVDHVAIDLLSYSTPRLFEIEQRVVFGDGPLAVGHVDQVRDIGDFFGCEAGDRSVLVVRQVDGQLAAFSNVCRHRGCALLETPSSGRGKAAFTCPYHGWRYGIDGILKAIPDGERSFPGLDVESRSLARLPVCEAYGLVWMNGEGGDDHSFRSSLPFDEDLASYHFENYRFLRREDVVPIDADWKLAIEAFLETYHFDMVHPAMRKYVFRPQVSLCDSDGPNLRILAPKKSILQEAERRPADRRLREHATVLYLIYPTTLLFVEKHHGTLLRFEPIEAGRCRAHQFHFVDNSYPIDDDYWTNNVDLFLQAFAEDLFMACSVQRGASRSVGPERELIVGRSEVGVARFREAWANQVGSEWRIDGDVMGEFGLRGRAAAR